MHVEFLDGLHMISLYALYVAGQKWSKLQEHQWHTFTLTKPFRWDGKSNLVVQFSYDGNSETSDHGSTASVTTGVDRMIYYCVDSDTYRCNASTLSLII